MKKVVFSGGPSTGKTTIYEMARTAYPDAFCVEEAAEIVIKRELAKQEANPSYAPIMPLTDYRKFAPLVISQQEVSEAAIPADADLVLMDRSIIDNLGYQTYNGMGDYVDEIREKAVKFGYSLVFFCDWLGKLEQTAIRRETEEQGLSIQRHLEAAYVSSGLEVIHLPAVSPSERLEIVQNTIRDLV